MEQSSLTGKRLAQVIPRITSVSHSTMRRAEQTAQLIVEQLKDFEKPIVACDLIREGAPVPPTPESQAYRPNERVSTLYYIYIISVTVNKINIYCYLINNSDMIIIS